MRASMVCLVAVMAACEGGATPGDAGGDGATPGADVAADAAPPTPADAIVRMCLMNTACGYQTRFYREADRCVDQALDLLAARADTNPPEHRIHFARMVECARTSRTCDEYVRCADFGVACSGVLQPRCDGSVRNACSTPGSSFQPRTFDCAALAGGSCAAGDCVYPSTGAPCAGPGLGRCDGDVRVFCRASAGGGTATELRDPCPAGTRCQGASTYGSADPACYPTTACAAQSLRCDGDVMVLCNTLGGSLVELRTDCASVGRRCATDARGRASCEPRASECAAPASGTSATCDGDAVRVCIEGRLQRIECASVGRSACVVVSATPVCR